jgi:hypothetical protein
MFRIRGRGGKRKAAAGSFALRQAVYCVVVGFGVSFLAAGQPQTSPSPPPITPQGPPVKPQAPPGRPAGEHPLDYPLRLIGEARQSLQQVRDYTCTMIKQERVNGQLQPENVITLRVRQQPFAVNMFWHSPKQFANQEVCYVPGRNPGKMRVHSSGLLGAVGFVTVDVNDPRAMQHSRHNITEAGIGNLIEQYAGYWQKERQLNKTQVRLGEFEYNKRRCIRIEIIHTERDPSFYCYRGFLYLDKETKLPVRSEAYDWPRRGGPPEGDLLEVFSYVDMRFNTGLDDRVFNK